MFNIENLIEKISKDKKIENENLDVLIAALTKSHPECETNFSGYNIKNSLETFFGYVSKYFLEKENCAFYISKGNIYASLEKLGIELESTNSGFYANEVFFAKNIDEKYYNSTLVKFMGEIANNHYKGAVKITDKDIKSLLTPEKVSLFDVYKKIEKNHSSKSEIICHIFKTLHENNLINLVNADTDKLLFSYYNPMELYNSWYISELLIDKGVAEEIF